MLKLACPSEDQLMDYLQGRKPEPDLDEIRQHIDDCSECERSIRQIEENQNWVAAACGECQPEVHDQPNSTSQSSPRDSRLVRLGERAFQEYANVKIPFVRGTTNDAPFPGQMGTRWGAYEILNQIGHGGMGAVYLARHAELEKQVAIKILPPVLARNAEFVKRFRREIKAAGKLNHPAIVRATDAGLFQQTHFLVMEAIDGLDASRISRILGKLSVADACKICCDAAIGLSYAHSEGFVHRDIKPSNLMIDRQGQVKILDFGLARNLWDADAAEVTTVGHLMGTLDYMAPEQAERSESVDYRADIYSLGATLYRLLAGHPPLAVSPKLSPLEKLRLLTQHSPPPLDLVREDLPRELVKLVMQMLARDPADRPPSAAHVAQTLHTFASSSQLPALVACAMQKHDAQLESSSLSLSPSHQLPDRNHNPLSESEPQLERPRRMTKWIATGLFGLASGLGAILFTLEITKGQLIVQSEATDKVRVKLIDVEQQNTSKELTIEPGPNVTRLNSGNYTIELDVASDSVAISQDKFSISRGQTVVANIQIKRKDSQESAQSIQQSSEESDLVKSSKTGIASPVTYNGKTAEYYLNLLSTERNDKVIAECAQALPVLAYSRGDPVLANRFRQIVLDESNLIGLLYSRDFIQIYVSLLGEGDHFDETFELLGSIPENHAEVAAWTVFEKARQPYQVTKCVEWLAKRHHDVGRTQTELYSNVVRKSYGMNLQVLQAGLRACSEFDEDAFLFKTKHLRETRHLMRWVVERAEKILKQSDADIELVYRVLQRLEELPDSVEMNPLANALMDRLNIIVSNPDVFKPMKRDGNFVAPITQLFRIQLAEDRRFHSRLKEVRDGLLPSEADKTALMEDSDAIRNLNAFGSCKHPSIVQKAWNYIELCRVLNEGHVASSLISEISERANAKFFAERKIVPGDVLAIQIDGFVSDDYVPVLKAGERAPVVGHPVLVADDGTVKLPRGVTATVAGSNLSEAKALVKEAISKVFESAAVSVNYLVFAGETVKIQNLGSTTNADK
jgi:serine/threonine protein kinase